MRKNCAKNCAEIIPKVMGSRSDCMEKIYSEYDDKVVVVTGGAGFIGSHIAEYFSSEGHIAESETY